MTIYTASEAKAQYRAMLADYGESVTFLRAPSTTKTVKARLLQRNQMGEVGSLAQAARRFLVVADDLATTTAFPLPFLVKQDKVQWNGKTLTIINVDDTKRRVGGELIAYEIEAVGA